MVRSSHYFHQRRAECRLRPTRDAAYLNALAVRLADAAHLPLRVAKARVQQQLAVSAGAGHDRGGWPSQMR
jgi:hypothetical protein